MNHLHYSTKNVLIVVFLLLSLIISSPCVQGRNLRVLMSDDQKHAVTVEKEHTKLDTEVHQVVVEKEHTKLDVHHEEQPKLPNPTELIGMDYNPTSNKPPVHN
ncbi:hypothetical protein LINPERHAP1_LOCUS36829 [Linum perenne]